MVYSQAERGVTMRTRIKNMTYIALGAVIMAISAWITLPFVLPFTMQTFALFFMIYYFGAPSALASCLVYIGIGCVGIPVFSGFGAGFGVLFGITGGFIIGFPITCLIYLFIKKIIPEFKGKTTLISAISMLACYALGCTWALSFSDGSGFSAVVAMYILPYLVPDAIKITLAYFCLKRLAKIKA